MKHHGCMPAGAARAGALADSDRAGEGGYGVADKVLAAEGHVCNDKCKIEEDDEGGVPANDPVRPAAFSWAYPRLSVHASSLERRADPWYTLCSGAC
jgi:hypothetical protein